MLLIRNLPRESATIRAACPDGAWGDLEHLAASLIDVTYAVHGSERRWPRPGEKRAQIERSEARGHRWAERVAQKANQRGEASS